MIFRQVVRWPASVLLGQAQVRDRRGEQWPRDAGDADRGTDQRHGGRPPPESWPIFCHSVRSTLQEEDSWNLDVRHAWLHLFRIIVLKMKRGYKEEIVAQTLEEEEEEEVEEEEVNNASSSAENYRAMMNEG